MKRPIPAERRFRLLGRFNQVLVLVVLLCAVLALIRAWRGQLTRGRGAAPDFDPVWRWFTLPASEKRGR